MPHFVPTQTVRILDGFWQEEQRLVQDVVLPYQWEILNDRVAGAEPSHCIHNFRVAAGLAEGAYGGVVFQDTDLYKWLEAAAYCLMLRPDPALEALADGAVDLIASAQQPDGYLDTYYTIAEPGGRWTNLMEGHELYCAGHFIQAAVAYRDATKKDRALKIALRLADCIDRAFGPEEGKLRGYPGHPEIELALIQLFNAVQDPRYLRLAKFFLDVRGAAKENWFQREQTQEGHHYLFPEMSGFGAEYFQAHRPVREQRQATGHAVRAMYLYSAMAEMAALTKDDALADACGELFRDTTTRQMYVTGALGAAALGERFTTEYHLPNDTMYGETCASIGLMMFAQRMFLLEGDPAVYDVWERALYNAVLAGMGTDGQRFFYVNPLAVDPEEARKDPTLRHVKTTRQKWFGVACCPPNLARALSSLGGGLYAMEPGKLWVLAHIASAFEHEGARFEMTVRGTLHTIGMDAPPMDVILRQPEGFRLEGDPILHHGGGRAEYSYRLIPQVRVLRASARVAADAGKLCVMRGQTVYCMEEADNGKGLCALYADASSLPREATLDFLPKELPALVIKGWRRTDEGWNGALYSEQRPVYQPTDITLVPYSRWNNRGEGEMQVWINEALPTQT